MVGFFHVDAGQASADGYLYAKGLVQSVRRAMPDVPIVHFTDTESRAVKGVDDVRRKPSEPMALLRMRHHAGVTGDWLFVDTDVIVQRSVERVFREHAFDIAVTDRTWPHLRAAVGFTERMPFNTGVVFSRSPRFWGEVYTRLRELSPAQQQWMGDQEVICDMVTDDACAYDVTHLKGSKFNYPPDVPSKDSTETQDTAFIVHYKGPQRKPMLLKRLAKKGPKGTR